MTASKQPSKLPTCKTDLEDVRTCKSQSIFCNGAVLVRTTSPAQALPVPHLHHIYFHDSANTHRQHACYEGFVPPFT